MKTVGIVVLALLVAFLALAIGGGLFALLSYGVGILLTRLTGIDPLPATVLSMASMFLFGILVERAFNSITSIPRDFSESDEFDEDDLDYEDEDFLDFEDEEEPEETDDVFSGVPLWRRPLKTLDFSNVKPDDRCPCGSGRKFKNCHGRKSKEIKS
jgi:hypothetical protein